MKNPFKKEKKQDNKLVSKEVKLVKTTTLWSKGYRGFGTYSAPVDDTATVRETYCIEVTDVFSNGLVYQQPIIYANGMEDAQEVYDKCIEMQGNQSKKEIVKSATINL